MEVSLKCDEQENLVSNTLYVVNCIFILYKSSINKKSDWKPIASRKKELGNFFRT